MCRVPENRVDLLKKGTLYLIAGWSVSLIAGYGINVWLARFLGPAQYGVYGVVMSLLLWIEIGVISGIPTGVQKFVAAHPGGAAGIVKKSSVVQLFYISLLFVLSWFLAPFAAGFFKNSNLTFYLRIAVFDLWVYGFYFIYLSLQNGLHNFRNQACLIALYSASKLVFVILLVKMSGSITGAFIANICGSFAGLFLSLYFSRNVKKTENLSVIGFSEIISFAAPIAVFSLAVNLFLNVDLWVVKYFLSSSNAGFYVSASTVARIPYFLFFALSSTVLPMMSRALSKKDLAAARQIISDAVKFLIICLTFIVSVTAAFSKEIMILLFSDKYAAAGDVVKYLIIGMSFLALFFLFSTILNADNKPKTALLLTVSGVILDVFAAVIFVPKMGIVGGAAATTVALFFTCAAAWIVIFKRFGKFFNLKSGIKIILSGAVIYFSAVLINPKGFLMIGSMAALLVIYLILLYGFGEISFNFRDLIKK